MVNAKTLDITWRKFIIIIIIIIECMCFYAILLIKVINMSSFLATVLAGAEQDEMSDLNEKITEITTKISSMKLEVRNMMENNYNKFNMLPQETYGLTIKAQALSQEMDVLLQKIETEIKQDLQNSTGELKSLSSSLQETSIALQIVQQLVEIDRELKSAKQKQNEGRYFETAQKLHNVQSLLEKTADINLDILKTLGTERSVLQETLLYDMLEIWKSSLQWEESEPEKDIQRVCLKIETANMQKIQHMMQTLNYFEHLAFNLRKFANKVLRYLLIPLITEEKSVEIFVKETVVALEVESKLPMKKPDYKTVFMNTNKIFEFFHTNLNVHIDKNTTFLQKLGEMISDEFCENLIKHCLSETIPSNSNDLGAYDIVAKATEKYQEYLVEIGFLGDNNRTILEYAKNVDVLFANKTCQILLSRAREIMKKDLHDMMKVGPIEHFEEAQEKAMFDKHEFQQLKPEVTLCKDMFQFPECQISKSAEELLQLVHEVLDEAVRSTDFCSVRLFYTARNIFELYIAVVPEYHKQFLETIPQQVALFHNNCMYLAHHQVTLAFLYRDKFPQVLKSHNLTFVDQVHSLRKIGTEMFLKCMQCQRNQILEILRESGLATLGEDPTLTPTIEKAIRQCLRQLELLQTVWRNVLPSNVYSNSLGCLLNAFVEDLIIRVTTVEDIPAATAVHLVNVFGIVIERAPQIFPDPKEVHHYVKLWYKFKELVLVLGAKLREIDDRWADGKGPLAQEFSPDEIKQLIRALFQNTERRANVLSRIK